MISFLDSDSHPAEAVESDSWQQIRWMPEVEEATAEMVGRGDLRGLAQLLRADLGHRQSDQLLRRASRRMESLWSVQAFPSSERCRMLGELLDNRPKGRLKGELKQWLKEVRQGEPLTPGEMLLMTEFLAAGARELKPKLFFEIWQVLLEAALHLREFLSQTEAGAVSADERLLLEGELAFRMGVLFAGVEGAEELRIQGTRELGRQLLEYTDSDGIPFGALLTRWDFWLAPLVRSLEWSRRFGCELWSAECDERFRALVQFGVRLLDDRGRFPFIPGRTNGLAIIGRAVALAGFSSKSPESRLVKRLQKALKNGKRPKTGKTRPNDVASGHSDWSQTALLRPDWSPSADLVTVTHYGNQPAIDVRLGGDSLMSGFWGAKLKRGQRSVAVTGNWNCVCWSSDEDGDYAEFECRSPGKYRIQRQVYLSRQRRLLLLADAISVPRNAAFEFEMQFPLVDGLATVADEDSREILIDPSNGQRVRVFPLALEQDRVLNATGTLSTTESGLVMRQRGRGAAWMPVIFSWDQRFDQSSADWKSLTVTEDRRTLDRSESSAYRLRLGKLHLLLTRRLNDSEENQAVLGHHHDYETVIGEFDKDGDVQPWLLVE